MLEERMVCLFFTFVVSPISGLLFSFFFHRLLSGQSLRIKSPYGLKQGLKPFLPSVLGIMRPFQVLRAFFLSYPGLLERDVAECLRALLCSPPLQDLLLFRRFFFLKCIFPLSSNLELDFPPHIAEFSQTKLEASFPIAPCSLLSQ